MFVVVGLGNNGERYAQTRHNAGRLAASLWALRCGGSFVSSKKYHGDVSECIVGTETVLTLLPATFMNESGGSVRKAVTSKKQAAQLIVLHDDIDLPLGTIRISFARGSGGHNGVRSIARVLQTEDFVRIRIGIAPRVRGVAKKPHGEDAVIAWVMGDFKKAERVTFTDVCTRVGEAIETIVTEGREVAMNRFN